MLILYFAIILAVDSASVTTPRLPISKPPPAIDYYWREFDGVIPHDAVPGGLDKSGEEIYIGQAFIKEYGLLPSTIFGTDKKVLTVGGGKVFNPTENVKILCSGDASKFLWIPVKIEGMLLLTHCHLIAGGSEAGSVLSIGRAVHDRMTLIGKVYSPSVGSKGLWLPHNLGQVNYQTFEILAYGCEFSSLKNISIFLN